MTTPAAEMLYLAQHLVQWQDKGYAVYNPLGKPLGELPVIYGFNNGGEPKWLEAIAIAEDGNVLGAHVCSNEGYMMHDLGILEGARPDRHEGQYREHYPDGYRMDFVPNSEVDAHEALQKAFALNKKMQEAGEPT